MFEDIVLDLLLVICGVALIFVVMMFGISLIHAANGDWGRQRNIDIQECIDRGPEWVWVEDDCFKRGASPMPTPTKSPIFG